jgi:hypothetical protein
VERFGTRESEARLVAGIAAGTGPFADAVDSLVGCLLSELGGYSARPTDGVIFEWEEIADREAGGTGVVVMIDGQRVEPLRVSFRLDRSGRGLSSGSVCFGDADRDEVPYGSAKHERMIREILVDPGAEFRWKACFHRDARGWRDVPLGGPPGPDTDSQTADPRRRGGRRG